MYKHKEVAIGKDGRRKWILVWKSTNQRLQLEPQSTLTVMRAAAISLHRPGSHTVNPISRRSQSFKTHS